MSKNSRSNWDLINNKISNKITKVSKSSQQNNSENIVNKHDKQEAYIPPEERQKIYS